MPHLLAPPLIADPVERPRIRWNITQYESLFSMGLLEHGKYELLDGDIVAKMSIKYNHARVITRLFALLSQLFGFDLLLSAFSARMNNEALPEPDFAVLYAPNPTLTTEGHVYARDLKIVIEVSDSTIDDDLTRKAGIYARAQIAEYWVLDVSGRRLLIHGSPDTTGYTHIVQYDEADTAAPLVLPTATFFVSELLP